jgi:hypothetical protein
MTPPPKIVASLARELAEVAATEVGACIRPLAVRRIDTETGARATIPIPCGSTKASKCPPCADRARRLRMWQAHEGRHLDTDPEIVTAEPTAEQLAVIGYRADLEAARAAALAEDDTDAVRDLERAIGDADDMLRAAGARGTSRPPGERKPRRVRSTRRRQDAPSLPRLPVADRTTGRTFEAPDGRTYRPSTFLTLTLPSYGRMYSDGSPVDPAGYDYRRAARDAIHFGDLVDRFVRRPPPRRRWATNRWSPTCEAGSCRRHAALFDLLPRHRDDSTPGGSAAPRPACPCTSATPTALAAGATRHQRAAAPVLPEEDGPVADQPRLADEIRRGAEQASPRGTGHGTVHPRSITVPLLR